jgi:DnaK suppressor protein
VTDPLTELRAKRAEVTAELDQLTTPPPDTGGISFGKRIGDGTSIAVERIAQVAAHDGLHGTYGVCDTCGTPIAPARLEARFWSTHCVSCA